MVQSEPALRNDEVAWATKGDHVSVDGEADEPLSPLFSTRIVNRHDEVA